MKTSRRRRDNAVTPTALPVERRVGADRRDDNERQRLEMILDRGFRPGRWAARAAYALGLQGGPHISVDEQLVEVSGRMHAPLRIAFASDFHAGPTTDNRILADACARLHALRPDVVLLGGDFVTVRADDIHALATMLADVHAPLGKFGVFGNHDLRGHWQVVRDALSAAGVRMLVNEVVHLPAPHGDVSIIGLDDPIIGDPDGSLFDDARGVRVVLMHAPDGLLAARDEHFDLALCGHTHGGQIVLPGGVKPYLPHGKLSRQFAGGRYQLGPDKDRTLVVSRGVGCSTLPVRIGCSAEVHLVTVTPRPRTPS